PPIPGCIGPLTPRQLPRLAGAPRSSVGPRRQRRTVAQRPRPRGVRPLYGHGFLTGRYGCRMERDAALAAVFMPVQPASTFEETLDRSAWAALDYRLAIEAGAVLLAAERGGAEQFDRLDELVAKMDDELEAFEEFRRTDIRFHIGIAEAARSPRLLSAMTDAQSQMSALIALIAHPPEILNRSNEQHARLVKALRKGDGPRAVREMREHTEGTEHILAGLLPVPLALERPAA